MPRTIQCNQCGIILNLPENSSGKRLKCPKCGTKFLVGPDSSQYPSSAPSGVDASAASSMTNLPGGGHGDLSLPTASGDLRDTFDLPMMTEAANGAAGVAKSQATADALMLFDEKKPAPRRKLAAEARAQARRCPTCGGVVPIGMSICSSCGLDLESGTRVQLDDDLMPEAPRRIQGPPIAVTVIALVSLLGSLILGAYAAVQYFVQGVEGCQYFIPLCLFGGFAAVQLLRGRTAKLLIVALTLGAMIDVVALIAMPIFIANQEAKVVAVAPNPADEMDAANIAIEPITERLDSQKLGLGIAILLLYAAVSAYLASPSARSNSERS